MRDAPSADNRVVDLSDVELTLSSQAGPVQILRGVSLRAGRGERIGVVGPSGSGKSTMMMIMGGLERASAGAVRINGRDFSVMSEDQLAAFRRDHVGIVFQAFHLIPTMSALENVAIPLEFAGRADAFQQAEAQLEQVGLAHRLSHYPGQLSGGEQQRVALARALVAEPTLLLADEPTGNLDGATGAHVMDLLFALSERTRATLMLITHDTSLVERCTRIVRLADGRIVEDGGTDNSAAEDSAAAAALG